MKKVILMAMAAALMCGCSSADDESGVNEKMVTFHVDGDFSITFSDIETRTALTADNNTMTDLWVFDYIGNECVQTIHQTNEDALWGTPTMSLRFGTHHLYFVVSRGAAPEVDAENHTITFGTVRDTFWKDYEIEVTSSTNANRTVDLDRVVTRLRLIATDAVPEGIATVTITPATWYSGLNYLTGEPTDAKTNEPRTINIPSSYVGTEGEMVINVFGFSSNEWTTNVDVVAKKGDGTTLGQAVVANVPIKRNISTILSGTLFGKVSVNTITIDDEWLDDLEMTF